MENLTDREVHRLAEAASIANATEDRAREMFAEEVEKLGWRVTAGTIRGGSQAKLTVAAIRAVARALSQPTGDQS